MLTWGVITVLMGYTKSMQVFCGLRLALGVAEAGFYPGVIYCLTLWFPQSYRARVLGVFTLGSALANMLGSLVGGWLLSLNGVWGLAGWQWVFIATGLPAVRGRHGVQAAAGFVSRSALPERAREGARSGCARAREARARRASRALESAARSARDAVRADLYADVDVALRRDLLAADAREVVRHVERHPRHAEHAAVGALGGAAAVLAGQAAPRWGRWVSC